MKKGVKEMEDKISVQKARLKAYLRTAILVIKFTKMDGSERTMRCTLNPTYLPKNEGVNEDYGTSATTLDDRDVISVWDLDKSDWRSMKVSHIKDVKEEEDS